VSFLNAVVTRLAMVGPMLAWAEWVHARGWGLAGMWRLAGAWEIVATVIAFDGMDYWWHRFNHTVPLLWRFHRVHHLDTHVDVTTSLRFHIGELFFSYLVKCAWILLWGPSVWGLVAAESLVTAYSQFHHANIDFPDRVERAVRWIHMTPRVHASHHTVTPRTRNANYSTIFFVWDRLFGTFREPDFAEMRALGLAEGRAQYLLPVSLFWSPFMRRACT
jgi:sterol desaturase/sphingolipid hydroxylase (fatty acid hydroxylase superfamily)